MKMLGPIARRFSRALRPGINEIKRMLEFSGPEAQKKGIEYLKDAERAGNVEAQCFMVVGHRDGRYGIEKDADRSRCFQRKLKARADSGDAEAQFFYATTVQTTDPDEYEVYLRRSADQGFGRAIAERGLRAYLFEKEKGRAYAIGILRRGVEAGDPFCENALGTVLLLTHEGTADLKEAAELLGRAAEKGNGAAKRTLKMMVESDLVPA